MIDPTKTQSRLPEYGPPRDLTGGNATMSSQASPPVSGETAASGGMFGPIAAGVGVAAGLQESAKTKSLQPLASNLLMAALLFA